MHGRSGSVGVRRGDLASLVCGVGSLALGLAGMFVMRDVHVLVLEQAAASRVEFALEMGGTDIAATMGLGERVLANGTMLELLGQFGLLNLVIGFSLGAVVASGVVVGAPSAWRLGRRVAERWVVGRRA